MPNTKTWVVNSETSRHPELDGETVPLDGAFSNGMEYPGDPSGGAEQTAGCTCTMDVNFVSFQDPQYGTNATHDARVHLLRDTAPKELLARLEGGGLVGGTRGLREAGGDLTKLTATQRDAVEAVDEIIENYGHEFQSAELLSRGVFVDEGSTWFAPKIGQTWRDEGYLFTSMSERVGADYAAGGGWKVEMLVQKGDRAMAYDRHQAMILPRGMSWRVVDVDEAERVVRMVSESA